MIFFMQLKNKMPMFICFQNEKETPECMRAYIYEAYEVYMNAA